MTIKIDFARVFPGLVVFLLGLGLLVAWVLMAVVSFFVFFVPPLHGFFYIALDVLAASLVLMGSGALLMLAGVSGWWGTWRTGREPTGFVERRAMKDRLGLADRFGEFFALLVSGLIALFFVENQLRNTGFFTQAFGPREQLLFYGPWVFGAAVGVTRAVYGRRNAVRPLEAAQQAFWAVAALALLSSFPFSFAHLVDLIPAQLQVAFFWVSDAVGRVVLLLIAVGNVAGAIYTSALYASIRAELHGSFRRPRSGSTLGR